MDEFDSLIGSVSDKILNPLVFLFLALAVLYFLWGVFEYVRDYDSEEAKSKGAKHMLWGIIGIFIMVTAFGILNLIGDTIQTI